MSEEEALGKLAYEAYHDDAIVVYGGSPGSTIAVKWSDQVLSIWIAVAKAVAERVLQEVQVAEEASE